jgi:putative SOS response-associated peptidase YedK
MAAMLAAMCGRYVIKHSRGDLQAAFDFAVPELELEPRYNIAPTTAVPIVRLAVAGGRELTMARWGLVPGWAKEGAALPLMINARCETIASKPAFRSAFKTRRCIFPASGYYEWQKTPAGRKQPFFIERTDGRPLAFAGLWEEATRKGISGAIVTAAAAPALAGIHDRMPVILPEARWARWLDGVALSEEEAVAILGAGLPHEMRAIAVRSLVNSIRNHGPELLEPAAPAAADPDLFGA